ncbi:MAG: glycosyltransferase family 39 protein [Candidatus Aquilonibacter sp.]
MAALVRVPLLLHDGLWRDNAYIYVTVSAPSYALFFHRLIETEWHPPLYFLATYYWVKLVGISELSLKTLPFLCSVLTVPAIYRLGKLASNAAVGLLAAIIFALSPLAIVLSSEDLYPVVGLFCVVLAYLVMKARVEPLTLNGLACVTAVTAVTVYTHYVALLYVPLLIVWATFSPRGVKHGIAVGAALLLGLWTFIFWLPVFVYQRHLYLPFNSPSLLVQKGRYIVVALYDLMPVPTPFLAAAFCVALFGMVVFLLRRGAINRTVLALGAIFAVLLLAETAERLTIARYIFPIYGLLCVFFAWVLDAFWRRALSGGETPRRKWWAAAGVAFCAIVVIADIAYLVQVSAVPKSGIRSFAASVPFDRQTLYVIAPDYMASTFAFYSRNAGVAYRGFARVDEPELFRLDGYAPLWSSADVVEQGFEAMVKIARGYRRLDVVVDDDARDRGALLYGKVWPFLHLIESHYRLENRRSYAGRYESVSVYRFSLDQ